MSSSAPRRQRVADAAPDTLPDTLPNPSPYAYADAEVASATGSASEAGDSSDERNRLLHAEGFEQGRQSAQQQLRSEFDAALGRNRSEISRALQEFALERQNYYRRIEGEVVELALAIARKILHREVQIDPQALAGIVRITVEKLDAGTRIFLHVHPQEAADWRHYFACLEEDRPAPEIHEDAALAQGECRIETSLGSTEVGFVSQLKEIETGLLDLLAERPGAPAPNRTPQVR